MTFDKQSNARRIEVESNISRTTVELKWHHSCNHGIREMCCLPSDAKRQHVELVKDRRLFDQRIAKMKDECEGMMIAKFGGIVNLEELESMTVNQQLEEVKGRLSVAEGLRAADLQLWNVRSSHRLHQRRITDTGCFSGEA